MVRLPQPTRPTASSIWGSVDRGLRIDSNITAAAVPSVTFEPTIGITARRIDKLGMDIRSFREPLTRVIREVVAPSIRKNFDVGGRPGWEPHSSSTEEIISRLGRPSRGVLVATGTLRQVAGQLNIWDISQDAAILRGLPSHVWYGAIHQAGRRGTGRANTIPQRQFVMLQRQDEADMAAVFEKWLGERIDAAWPRRRVI